MRLIIASRKMSSFRYYPVRRALFCALLGAIVSPVIAISAEEGKLPPEILDRLESAKTFGEQRKQLRSGANEIPDEKLRDQLLQRAYDLTLTGDYSRAAADLDLALRLAREAGAGEQAARAQLELSFVLRESGDLSDALASINQAVAFFEAHPQFQLQLIAAEQARGIIYLSQSDFAHALESLHRALTLSQKSGDKEAIIPALNSIGEVYRTQGQPQRALEFYERAR